MKRFHILPLLLIAGCDKPVDMGAAKDSAEGDGGPCTIDTPSPEYEALFDASVLQEVRLEISADGIAALNADPATYVTGNFEHGGIRIDNVGIRLKGSSTFQDFSGKPAFKIKFDEFVEEQLYGGDMERLALNNLTNDVASGREVVAYQIWNQAGMMAPRASYAKVYVNGEYYGLYAALEAMDDEWVEKRYCKAKGDLWEANDSADFTSLGMPHFDLSSGDGEGIALAEAVAVLAQPADDYYATAGQYVDMDQFIDFWAWSMATGNLDGYPYNLNDYFLYGDPEDEDRFHFSPWGLDETWDTGWYFQWGQGVVGFNCASDYECLQKVKERTEAALQAYEAMDVPGMFEDAWALTDAAMLEDPRMPWTGPQVQDARAQLISTVAGWPDFVRSSMAGGR